MSVECISTLSYMLLSFFPISLASIPTILNQKKSEEALGVGKEGSNSRLSKTSMPISFLAKSCAFLLQLSEGLNKEKMQLCSNILIIYCSAALITVHHHLEWLIRTEEEFSLSFLSMFPFNLIFPSSPHLVSHGFRYMERKNVAGEKKMATPLYCWNLDIQSVIISSECHQLVTFYLCHLNFIG